MGVLTIGTPLKTGVQSEWASMALAPDAELLTREQLMGSEAAELAKALFSPTPPPSWAEPAIARADGRFRSAILRAELPGFFFLKKKKKKRKKKRKEKKY